MLETPTWMEVLYIRGRTATKTGLRLCGLALVLLGAFNMFIAPFVEIAAVAPYRQFGMIATSADGDVFFLGDALVMAAGAAVAWFV